jgi:hypothetical protein
MNGARTRSAAAIIRITSGASGANGASRANPAARTEQLREF